MVVLQRGNLAILEGIAAGALSMFSAVGLQGLRGLCGFHGLFLSVCYGNGEAMVSMASAEITVMACRVRLRRGFFPCDKGTKTEDIGWPKVIHLGDNDH